MSLGAKDVSPFVRVYRVIGVKQEVEVLDCLGEEEALLAVLETLVVHIVNSSVTTSANYHENRIKTLITFLLCFRVVIEALQDVSADMKVEGVPGGSVEKVGGLRQLRPQRVEADIGRLQLPVITLGQAAVLAPHGVIHGVVTDGLLHIPGQDLTIMQLRLPSPCHFYDDSPEHQEKLPVVSQSTESLSCPSPSQH